METNGKRLRLLFPDVHGLERGKYLFGDVAEAGHAAFCIGVYPLTHDREILPVPQHPVRRGPARHRRAPRSRLAAALVGARDRDRYRRRDLPRRARADRPSPRAAAGGRAWRAMGLEPQISFELEFYLMEPDGGGGWRPVSLPGHRVYGTGTSIDPTGCVDEIVTTALACGFPVESWGSEYDESAFEVNIRYADAIPAADDAFVFRLLIREIAERHGKLATFIGRPLNDRGGSGMHVNFSFRRADGSNAFHDPNDPEGLSDLARRCIAGLLEHHAGMAAIMAPHVNAYKRLQPDMLNGYWANWGHDDRSVTVRVPPARGETTQARAAHGRRGREPVPGRRGGAARGPFRRGGRAGAEAAAAGRRRARHRRVHPGEPRRRARRAERRRPARAGARPRARGSLHDLETRRVGAVRGGRGGHRRAPT